ncbi:hypothetical protein ACX03_05815 [Vibrio parahaemolyticus]|uniref:hypothetical protein n=1 Tax=Vibrio diabolicus TaxID=50719 RepID=UPI0006B26A66|nr:hypothetical protein [Vibrio diabolicus]EKG9575383.1 hypothetical protein [Vibrio parahaemolyticus]EKL9982116.1 hypothetical protein [Vibrio parahaemolyticus]KOY46529.1 hypothetical protein ACX03_05815 [Vibrio parahaemolyticus]MBE3853806.1 hypothetical protein [Vibrio parahaemolyticus]MCS0433155.1 hypothetical protein [Vibrio diabolicus]
MQEEKRSYIARSSGKSSKFKLSYWLSILVLTESNFFAETLLVEFVGAKADLLAEMAFSLVW